MRIILKEWIKIIPQTLERERKAKSLNKKKSPLSRAHLQITGLGKV
jgi:hypothetical protein